MGRGMEELEEVSQVRVMVVWLKCSIENSMKWRTSPSHKRGMVVVYGQLRRPIQRMGSGISMVTPETDCT